MCEDPEVLDTETNTCVIPEPETPTCTEPEVLDIATNMCVIPEPEIPQIDVGLMCHIPPGNPENPQTIMISPNAYPAHLAHGDYEGACTGIELEIQEFSVITDNETLNEALEILRIALENLNADSDVGDMISEAAQLHKLFVNEDKMFRFFTVTPVVLLNNFKTLVLMLVEQQA